MRALTLVVIVGAISGMACTVGQTKQPSLTGPSTFGTSLKVTATPDLVLLNGQQSVVMVEAFGPSGEALSNLKVHLDIAVNGRAASCGRLSLTDVTTGSDGRTGVVFTAPAFPLPLPECVGAATGVTIFATPVGTNAQVSNGTSAGISFLVPSSATTPGGGAFAVNFVMAPNPANVGQNVTFSDSASVSPGHSIINYNWSFGDGSPNKSGGSVIHDYGLVGDYTVTLTITDDIGQSGSKSALLTIK